jgi:hypothetical protein
MSPLAKLAPVPAGFHLCGWCESGHHRRCVRYIRVGHPTLPDLLCWCAEKRHAEQGVLR